MHKWKKCNTNGYLCLLEFFRYNLYIYLSIYLYISIYTQYRSATYIIYVNMSITYSIQLLSNVRLFETPWTASRQALLSITDSWSLLKLMSIALVIPSNHFILCRPLLLPPSIFPGIRVFSNELAFCIRWPDYWSFSFSNSACLEIRTIPGCLGKTHCFPLLSILHF